MSDKEALYARFGVASIPIYYVQMIVGIWKSDNVQLATSAVGTAVLVVALYRLATTIWKFIRPSTLQIYCHSETGSWALVTGGNDGIGKAWADELLSRGFNVLLHGRNPDKLKKTQSELAARYPRRKVETVVADAASYDHPERVVAEKVKQLPGRLTILINNVGGINSSPVFQPLAEATSEAIDTQININARFTVQLTSLLMPELIKNKPGLIILSGSGAGLFGGPYLTTYSATKGFCHSFAKALAAEMVVDGLDKDIEVRCVMINNTRSQGNTSEMPFFTIDAKDLVNGALRQVGDGGSTISHGSWRHLLQTYSVMIWGEKWSRKFMVGAMTQMRTQEQEKLAAKGKAQ